MQEIQPPLRLGIQFDGDEADAVIAYLLQGFSQVEERWQPLENCVVIDVDPPESGNDQDMPHFLIKGTAVSLADAISVTFVVLRNISGTVVLAEEQFSCRREDLRSPVEDIVAATCALPGGLVWQVRFQSAVQRVLNKDQGAIDEVWALMSNFPQGMRNTDICSAPAAPPRAQTPSPSGPSAQMKKPKTDRVEDIEQFSDHLTYFGYQVEGPDDETAWYAARHDRYLTLYFRELAGIIRFHATLWLGPTNISCHPALLEKINGLNYAAANARFSLAALPHHSGSTHDAIRVRANIPKRLERRQLGTLIGLWQDESKRVGGVLSDYKAPGE